jgi:LacI family transcriptional regulator
MIRIKDIAQKASVSTATVSYVLNGTGGVGEKTRKKVLQVIQELDYKPNPIAKSLKMKKTNTIGVVVEDLSIFNVPYIIDGINSYMDQQGFNLILTNMRLHKLTGRQYDSPIFRKLAAKAIKELVDKQVEGLIYIGLHTRDVGGMMPGLSKPMVYTYCYSSQAGDYSINYDDEYAAYEATRYLIDRGHRRIAVISGVIDSVPSHDRFQGHLKAMMDSQLPFDPGHVKTGDWEVESGYRAAKELLLTPEPPTAFLAMNDLMAVGVMNACDELGLSIPNDVSVVGFDNREFSSFLKPALTTMELPLLELGERSAETLLGILNGKIPSYAKENVKPKCKLVERGSVRDIR